MNLVRIIFITNYMQSIREIMRGNKDLKAMAEIAKQRFLEKGYIYSEVYGWIDPKKVEKYGLDPNASAIPAQIYDELDYKDVTNEEKDSYGRKTGQKTVEKVPFKTGKKVISASERYLAYQIEVDRENERQYAELKKIGRIENSENY